MEEVDLMKEMLREEDLNFAMKRGCVSQTYGFKTESKVACRMGVNETDYFYVDWSKQQQAFKT